MTTGDRADAMTDSKCGAKKKQGEGTCTQPRGWGTTHPGYGQCKLHGGATKNGIAAAQREQAERAVVAYGLPIEVDPHTALLEELHRTAGHVAWLNEKVNDLQEDQMTGLVGAMPFPASKPSVWIEMYHQERAHLTLVAKTCIAAGIEERRVKVAEQTGQLFATIIHGILEDLGVGDSPEAPAIVRKHLVGLQGGQAA
jgi:hypothetical protein